MIHLPNFTVISINVDDSDERYFKLKFDFTSDIVPFGKPPWSTLST